MPPIDPIAAILADLGPGWTAETDAAGRTMYRTLDGEWTLVPTGQRRRWRWLWRLTNRGETLETFPISMGEAGRFARYHGHDPERNVTRPATPTEAQP
jgi:hypothetical protein